MADDQYVDSDSLVKQFLSLESESARPGAASLRGMGSGDPPEPLAEFVRHLIRLWEEKIDPETGKKQTLRKLKLAAGWPKSNSQVDQIKAGSSVTEYTGTKLAPPLGYCDYPDLVSAAYQWWRSADRSQVPASAAETPLAEAARVALGYGITHAQIDRVVQRVPPESQAELAAGAWLQLFFGEQSFEASVDASLRSAAHKAAAERAGVERKQTELRNTVEAKAHAEAQQGRRRPKRDAG